MNLFRMDAPVAEPTARCLHAAVRVRHNLMVWGGYGGSGSTLSSSLIETFNVPSSSWKQQRRLRGQSLPDGYDSMAVASDGERAYTFGGLVGPSGSQSHQNTLYSMNISSLTSREIVPANASESPSPRSSGAMVFHARNLVIHGGNNERGALDDLFVFDLDTSEDS